MVRTSSTTLRMVAVRQLLNKLFYVRMNNFLRKKKKPQNIFRYAIVFHVSCWSCRHKVPGLGSIAGGFGLCPKLSQWQTSRPKCTKCSPHFTTPTHHLPHLSSSTCSATSEDVIDSDVIWQFCTKVWMQMPVLQQQSHLWDSALWSPCNDPSGGSGNFWATEHHYF